MESAPARAPGSHAPTSTAPGLRVGIIPFPPFTQHSQEGVGPAGLYVNLLDAYGRTNGVEVKYRNITNEQSNRLLRDGTLDVVACLYRTPRRERDFDFAACLFAATIGAVVRASDDRFTGYGDLMKSDVRIAACLGEIGAELAVDQFGAERGSPRLVELDTVDVAHIGYMVAAGVADVAITDNITCRQIVDRVGPAVKHAFNVFPLYVGQIGLLLMRDREELRDHLTAELKRLRTGTELTEEERQVFESYDGMLQAL
ncbi:MAG: transporter substrate-binding domain-containing protein [Actinobacteria bacterium]|nr:transporter substrate-binding domain-containing protein [Actinomycetota bacterium]